MKYLLDTDTCIYFFNGDQRIIEKIRQTNKQNLYTSILNIAELKFGAYNSKKRKKNLLQLELFNQRINIISELSDEIITLFAKTKADLRKKGKTIGDFDLLIATFAIENNLTLVTNNISHFKNIKNLKFKNWIK
jgi:tRNA(fMet)-specific endonuclease VapC